MENEKNMESIPETATPAEEAAPMEEMTPAAETIPEADNTPAEETAPAEENAPAEETPEQKKATPGRIALMVAAIVVLIALIVALLAGGMAEQPSQETEPAAVETTQPAPTVPADGNPDDETCKGTYTVTDEEVKNAADKVVATLNGHELTNSQLQVLYWMQVQDFLSSEYGSYMLYYGVLNPGQSLDTQLCVMEDSGTWQQFFLKEALITWRNYCALADHAKAAGMELPQEQQEYLAKIEENLNASAAQYGLASAEELLWHNVGAGAVVEDYIWFQDLLIRGNQYYDAACSDLTVTEEELEAFFAAHESEYAESGITKEGRYVDVRHILFTPEGGTDDGSGGITYSDAEWEACRNRAADVLNAWNMSNPTEESFALLAGEYSQDPGSAMNGGLYENVYEGQMVPEFNDWCFDEKREPGHSGMVKTSYGYHLMYFVGSSPIWRSYAEQDLMAEKRNALVEEVTAGYVPQVSYSDIVLGYVSLTG